MRHTPSSRTTGLAVLFAGLFMLGTAHAAEYQVKMLNNGPDGMMVFEPGFLKIQPGDSVRFVPADPGHIVESYSLPAGGTTWISEFNQEIKVTFDKEGVYIYKCKPHIMMAMVGVIQVGKPVNLNEARKSAAELSQSFMMNKDRLDNYLAKVK